MSAAGTAQFGNSTPFAAFLKNTGSMAFGFMMPMLAGFISQSIADRPGLLVGIMAGALQVRAAVVFLGRLSAVLQPATSFFY